MRTLRDDFWIWGHDAGCHHGTGYNLPGVNRMGPVDGGEPRFPGDAKEIAPITRPRPDLSKTHFIIGFHEKQIPRR